MINKVILLIIISVLFAIIPISQSFADGRLDRCLPYKEYIVSLLLDAGISADYFYLAVCESGCRNVVSNKGAHGFFQVTYPIYKFYKPSTCSDEDIEKLECNVAAAAKYVSHLQERFKNMYVLIKAYNRGGTNYQRFGSTPEADGLSDCVKHYIVNKKE